MPDNTLPSNPRRYYQQIEEQADLNTPDIYDLLTFQRKSWVSTPDPLNQDFIPLTDVQSRNASDAKMFVIGLLPPSANVTGNLLDRSATVASIQGFSQNADLSGNPAGQPAAGNVALDKVPSGVVPGYIVTAPGYQFNPTNESYTEIPNAKLREGAIGEPGGPGATTQHTPGEMYNAFHDAYVAEFHSEPTPTQLLFLVAQSRRESGGNWPNNNPGQIRSSMGASDPTAWTTVDKAGNTNYWNTYSSAAVGARSFVKNAFKNPNARLTAEQGDVLGYLTSQAQVGYFQEPLRIYYDQGRFDLLVSGAARDITKQGGPSWDKMDLPATTPDVCCFRETGDAYQKRVNNKKGVSSFRFNQSSLYNDGCPLSNTPLADAPNGSTPSWAGNGSDNAQKASADQSKAADKDLNQSQLGQKLLGAQKDYIIALQTAIQQMAQTPPLRMLVNPTSFKPAQEKVIADGSYGRNGPIVEHWGEQQTKITGSGKLAGFYAMDIGGSREGAAGSSPGLTRMARNFSQSYQNFLSLYLIYRNNGTIWLEEFYRSNPQANNLALVGSVYIYYDNVLYIGSFDSLNVNESDDKPFTLEYDFAFTVRAQFDLDRIPDPLEQFGNASLFATTLPSVASRSIPTDSSVTNPQPVTTPTISVPPSPAVPPDTILGLTLSKPTPLGSNPEIIPSSIGRSRGK